MYTRYCIILCDRDPPCRAYVHMFTIIQFLRARANIHTVLEGKQHVYCIQGNNGQEKLIVINQLAATNLSLCIRMQYRTTHPSGFMLLYRIL